MSRAKLIEMARRNLVHVKAGTVDQAPDVARVPVTNYYDPDRWRLEVDRIFKRLPLMLAFSAEIPKPGDYRALHVIDVPVLLTRAKDGSVRAFLNVCSHRSAVIVPDGSGNARRFICPYHAWTYDDEGRMVGIFKRDQFGDVDSSCLGLTALPVAERAGLIFVVLTPGAKIDFDEFLCGYDEVLAHHRFDECRVAGRQSIAGPNWKVAYDGYLDFYHLPILHRDTFGPKFPSDALYDAFGPHQRVSIPTPGYLELENKPEDEWKTGSLIAGVWTIFPHISITDFDAGGKIYLVSQLFPGATADESITVQNFLATFEATEESDKKIESTMKFLEHVVRDEDYFTGNRIQKALKTGARTDCLFGRNEAGGQRFHRWVDALIAAEDDQLPKLFAEGIGF